MRTPQTTTHSAESFALVELRCWIPRPIKDALLAQAKDEGSALGAVVRHVLYRWAQESAA